MPNQENKLNREGREFRFLARPYSRAFRLAVFAFALTSALAYDPPALPQAPARVRFTEGQIHGFLNLRTSDGALIANGDVIQVNHGDVVTSQLVLRFRDGSLQDETTVYTQSGHFRLLSDRLIQKGPAFKHPMDVTINGSTGVVTVHSQDDNGKEKVETATLTIPPDLANGMVPVLLMNMAPGQQSTTASMIVATPKPLLVKLAITVEGEDSFLTGSASHKAIRYAVKVDIPGVRGVVAPLVGKQPPDTHVWILSGSSPVFLKSEGPLCEGCAIWRTELTSPIWPEVGKPSTKSDK
jgi:hypothetical protein